MRDTQTLIPDVQRRAGACDPAEMLVLSRNLPALPSPDTSRQPETVGFLLVPGFTLMAFTSATEALRLANLLSGRELYRPVLVSRDGIAEASSAGIAVAADLSIGRAQALPTVIVCGGIGGHLYADPAVLAWLRRLAAGGATVGSLCTGSHVLARAGLLEGYRCTIHWENLAGFAQAFPRLDATGTLFTIDRKRFTCAGGTAALDLMLSRIGERHGPALAGAIAEQLLHDRIRAGDAAQRAAVLPDSRVDSAELAAALLAMRGTLEAPLPISAIALRAGASRRRLERLFQRSFGCSPARHYLRLRLQRAQQLLAQTALSVTDVSLSCGFASPGHFSRSYRAVFGVTPRVDRLAPRRGPESQGGSHGAARPAPFPTYGDHP